jgi:hypothetical protein
MVGLEEVSVGCYGRCDVIGCGYEDLTDVASSKPTGNNNDNKYG